MCAEQVDRQLIREFWDERSHEPRTRWTSDEVLAYELAWLRELVPPPRSVLDLGSGHGELSRALCPSGAQLTAVDFAAGYARSFGGPGHRFVQAGVTEFETDERFDLILLFGVVTSMDVTDEGPLYASMARWLADGGIAVVKNQVAVGESFVVTGHSEALGTRYSGRYPALLEQHARLLEAFAIVEEHRYPAAFNPWPTSMHTAFACRGEPRR